MTRFETGLMWAAVLVGIGALIAAVVAQDGRTEPTATAQGTHAVQRPEPAATTAQGTDALQRPEPAAATTAQGTDALRRPEPAATAQGTDAGFRAEPAATAQHIPSEAPSGSATAAQLSPASAAADAGTVPVPSPLEPRTGVIEPNQTLVLWTGSSDAVMGSGVEAEKAAGKAVTRFVRADDTVALTQPGLYIAVGDELYQWDTSTRSLPSSQCESQKNPYRERTLREAVLVAVRSGKRVMVVSFPKSRDDELPYMEKHTPIAIFGDTLFLRSDREFYECGIHPMYETKFRVFRLKAGGLRAVNVDELVPAASARIPEAEAKLSEYSLSGGGVEVTMIFPEFRASGVRWIAQYTTEAAWALSDGLWSGYSRSERLELSARAKGHTTPGTVPDAVVRYVRAHPDERIHGFSVGKDLPQPYGSGPPADP